MTNSFFVGLEEIESSSSSCSQASPFVTDIHNIADKIFEADVSMAWLRRSDHPDAGVVAAAYEGVIEALKQVERESKGEP